MGNYLEKSLQAFVDQQHLFREQMRTFIGKNPLAMMTELVEHNLNLWQSVNERLKPFVPTPTAADPTDPSLPADPSDHPDPAVEQDKPAKDQKTRRDKAV
jgi:polyhydroxyalkanoate synthesis regulator protein